MRQVLFSNDFVRDYHGLPESLRKKTAECGGMVTTAGLL
jgi:hypothetical protein